jgi:hypothetical protein
MRWIFWIRDHALLTRLTGANWKLIIADNREDDFNRNSSISKTNLLPYPLPFS